jgi:hypothetical protein
MMKRIAIAAFILLALAFVTQPLWAADITVSWTAPTAYVDGTALPASAIASYDVQYGTCSADKKSITGTPQLVNVPGTATSKVISGIGAGWVCAQARTLTANAQSAWATNADGTLASKLIILEPKPPGNLTVAGGNGVAYMAIRRDNAYAMLPVGTVAGGTLCDSTNGVIAAGKTYFAVPANSVTWYGTSQPTVALATCS